MGDLIENLHEKSDVPHMPDLSPLELNIDKCIIVEPDLLFHNGTMYLFYVVILGFYPFSRMSLVSDQANPPSEQA